MSAHNYNEWWLLHSKELEKKLAQEDHSEGEKLSAEVIPYSHLKNYILSDAPKPEILIACDDNGELTGFARTMICDYFAAHPWVNLLYADEDRVNESGTFFEPWFKSDWAPDTFLSTFYFGNIFAIRTAALALINPGKRTADEIETRATRRADAIEEQLARANAEAAQLHAWIYGKLCLKIAQADGGFSRRNRDRDIIGHIPEVLLHMKRAEKLWDGGMIRDSLTGRYSQESAKSRLISIIIPSKDNAEVLRRCVFSIERHVRVPYELIIVDNGSTEENREATKNLIDQINVRGRALYIYKRMPFNMSRLYNLGAHYASGEMLLFMHDDIVVQKLGWLSHLSEKAKLPYVGCVGIKMMYPSSEIIQHAGVINTAEGPVPKLRYCSNAESYYFDFNKGVRNVAAVSGACVMVRASIYREVGGFDEENFGDLYGDVEFCYRVYEAGYYNVVRNNMYLFYYDAETAENAATMAERMKRRPQELAKLREMHPALDRDPFYHRYLSQSASEMRFVVDLEDTSVR